MHIKQAGKVWEKIKRLNLKDENICSEKISARLATGESGGGSPWNNLNDVFISSRLTYLLRSLLRIRPRQRLMLSFQSFTIGIIQVVNKIHLFATGMLILKLKY